MGFKNFTVGTANRLLTMTRQNKVIFGVPTKDNVDYSKIYSYESNVINPNELFSRYLLNRGGRENAIAKHVQEIKNAIIKNGGMDKFPPITVDINTLQIIDGNCRFMAMSDVLNDGSMDLTLKVVYEDVSQEEFDQRVIDLNQGQKSWGLLDFIYNFSLRGNESYNKLIKFCESEPTLHKKDGTINPRYAGAALKKKVNDLKNSKLELTDEEVEIGKKVIEEAALIRKKFSGDENANGGGWYESYLRAWAEIRPLLGDISFKDYLKAVKRQIDGNKRNNPVPYGSNKKPSWYSFFNNTLSYEFGR